MRAVLLNSFPGITNVPYGMDYKYYHNALTLYYYPVKGLCYEPGIIIHKIGECLSRSAMTNEKLDQCMFYLCLIFGGLFFDAGGRRKILQCVKDWKVVISLYKTQFIVDAGAILDRISTFASSFFKFEQMPSVVRRQNYLNFGVISMEAESIPEVVRHTQRFTTTTTALLLWWYHLIQIEADIVFLLSPAASHNGSCCCMDYYYYYYWETPFIELIVFPSVFSLIKVSLSQYNNNIDFGHVAMCCIMVQWAKIIFIQGPLVC